MNFNSENASLENSKKREYLKQQHQLRTMTKTNNAISADDMIENLLSKKEIFQKKKDLNGPSSKQGQSQSSAQWPIWLTIGKEPALYKQVWTHVGLPTGFADTMKTSSLLLTSRLTTDTLGYIWSLTNLTVPGSLTQQELYISLALVALAQNGYTFTNASVVKQLLEAPMPRLELSPSEPAMPFTVPTPSTVQPVVVNFQQPTVPTVTETLSLIEISSEPVSLLEASPTKTLSILSATDLSKDFPSTSTPHIPEESLIFGDFQTNDDEFDDFKSADTFSSNINNLTVLDLKEPLSFESNQPLELGIKDLPPLLPVLESNDFSILDFNEPSTVPVPHITETIKNDTPPPPPEINSTKESDKACVEDLFPKCLVKGKSPPSSPDKPALQSFNPISHPVVDEDRYSALRILDCGIENEHQEFDEFGEFLTADPPNQTQSSSPIQPEECDIQQKCLEACLKLLKEAVSLFESIEDSKVLEEVTNDERGKNYLEEIVEVERIGRRIRSNRESSDLITEFESLSQALQPFIEPVKNNHMDEEDGPKCGLCLMDYGPAHVKYGINHFHAPCANLYLHRVDPILPIAPVM